MARDPFTRRREIPAPSDLGLDWPDLQAVADEHMQLVQERSESYHELSALEHERKHALATDLAKHADAVRTGKPEPERSAKAVEELLAIQHRRLDALDLAIDQAEQRFGTELRANRERYVADLEAGVVRERERLGEAVEEWARARVRLHRQRRLLAFVRGFPRERLRADSEPPIAGVLGRNHMPIPAAKVREALMAEARPHAKVPAWGNEPQTRPHPDAVYISPYMEPGGRSVPIRHP